MSTYVSDDQATPAQWDAARVLWRKLGWVTEPMPDGTVIPADKAPTPLSANRASPPPVPPPRRVEPARLPVTPPAADYKALAAGERRDAGEEEPGEPDTKSAYCAGDDSSVPF